VEFDTDVVVSRKGPDGAGAVVLLSPGRRAPVAQDGIEDRVDKGTPKGTAEEETEEDDVPTGGVEAVVDVDGTTPDAGVVVVDANGSRPMDEAGSTDGAGAVKSDEAPDDAVAETEMEDGPVVARAAKARKPRRVWMERRFAPETTPIIKRRISVDRPHKDL
jgi:hypothetical protein